MKIEIIPTINAEYLAKGLERDPIFHINYLQKNTDGKRFFPDGELYMRLDEAKKSKGRTVVLHSGIPNPNDGLVELEFILSMLKDRKANPIELFITYFPYSRQDKAFKKGEINIAECLVKNWIKNYGVKKIYIVDAHFVGEKWVKKYPIIDVCAHKKIMESAKAKYPGIVFITPDHGSYRRTKIRGASKKRKDSYNVEIFYGDKFKNIVDGKIVGVVDDMIETGGTLAGIGKKCKELGALKIIALVTHGVLKNGIKRIAETYDELFLANTINCENYNINISDLIKTAIKGK